MTDTLSIANNLSNAGVDWEQAEAISKSIADAVEQQQGDLATKDFVRDQTNTVRGEISALKADLSAQETRIVYWIVGTGLAVIGVLVAAGVLP